MKEQWCFPQLTHDFVWRMEDVLDLYGQPDNPLEPVVCFDERPCQLVADAYPAPAAQPGHVQRYDYDRHGTCNLFMMFQPLAGWRLAKVTEHHKKEDFAECLRELADTHFRQATTIHLVLDNLRTHTFAALYDAFEPAEALRIMRRFTFHFTPTHASWLNMVEIELSVLVKQCLNRRLPNIQTLRHQVEAWQNQRNAQHATVHWQFGVDAARTKLQRFYP